MNTIVKYRFDREMVSFVKSLDLKTAMFGYDKGDVYSKFKDLLVKARDVCEELVLEAYAEVEELKEALGTAAADPIAGEQLPDEASPEPVELRPAPPEAATDEGELARLRKENEGLRQRLEFLSGREELLQRAHDIVTEARLEREAIIRNAQAKAEEELFFFRAKQREEEALAQQALERLEQEKSSIVQRCAEYRTYVEEGQDLFEQLRAYTSQLDQVVEPDEAMPPARADTTYDPPVLSVDESLSCTEESMPLCEIVDQDPEGLFRGQDLADDPANYENVPGETDGDPECGNEG